jgi:hypothetical protein
VKGAVPRAGAPGLPKATETDILRAIRDFLRLHGWFVIRNQQGLGSHKGMPDLTVIRRGQVWWIEVKKSGGLLSADQCVFRGEIEDHGGNWLVARSIEDVEHLARR